MCKYQQTFLVRSSNIITFKDLTHKSFYKREIFATRSKLHHHFNVEEARNSTTCTVFFTFMICCEIKSQIRIDLSVGPWPWVKCVWIYAWILDKSNCQHDIHYIANSHDYGGRRTWNLWIYEVVIVVLLLLLLSFDSCPMLFLDKWFVQIHLIVKCLLGAFPLQCKVHVSYMDTFLSVCSLLNLHLFIIYQGVVQCPHDASFLNSYHSTTWCPSWCCVRFKHIYLIFKCASTNPYHFEELKSPWDVALMWALLISQRFTMLG